MFDIQDFMARPAFLSPSPRSRRLIPRMLIGEHLILKLAQTLGRNRITTEARSAAVSKLSQVLPSRTDETNLATPVRIIFGPIESAPMFQVIPMPPLQSLNATWLMTNF